MLDTARSRELFAQLDFGPAPESDAAARAWLARHDGKFGHFIGDQWIEPSGGQHFPTINPGNPDDVLAQIAHGNETDVDKAVKAAQAAFPVWSDMSGYRRKLTLYGIARMIKRHARLFAVLESLDNGKTIRETRDADIPLVAEWFEYHGGMAQLFQTVFPHRAPGGVIGQIIPWNFPLLMLAWKIAPAIAAGNTIVIKPAEYTPLTALLFAELVKQEVPELPDGVINIVTGDGEAGAALASHSDTWKTAFTGSTEVGRRIREATADSDKKLTLELGGKSPFIVCDDVDLDSVVEGVVGAIWFNQGQVCCAGSRLIVHEAILPRIIDKLKRRMDQLRGGDQLDKAMDMGVVNSAAQFEKITGLLEAGRAEGAEIYQPDGWPEANADGPWFIPPTICTGVKPAHILAREEIFGPVLVIMTFRTPDEAIQLANNTVYGLAASIWTRDGAKALAMAKQVKAGVVWINTTNAFSAAAGFGGVKESGFGREGGIEGMLDVTVEKLQSESDGRYSREPAELDFDPPRVIDQTLRFLVGGKLTRPDGGASFSVYGQDERFLGSVGNGNRKDVRNAVLAAQGALGGWSNRTEANRAQILDFWSEKLSAHRERFIRMIRQAVGCRENAAGQEFDAALELLSWWASYCNKYVGTVQPVPGDKLVTALKEPIGVLGIRAPDDYPLLGLVSSMAAAISRGNTVVTIAGAHPIIALTLVEIIQNSDIPAGVINLLAAEDPDARAKELAEHEGVHMMWNFGTPETHPTIRRAAIGNMKRVWCRGNDVDWLGPQGQSLEFLRHGSQIKNVWMSVGA